MVLFLIVSLVMLMVVIVAVEWLLDLLFSYGHPSRFPHDARMSGTQAELRARHQAEFNDICDDLIWQQQVIALGWPVSAYLAKRAFTLVATASAMLIGQAQENRQFQPPSNIPPGTESPAKSS